MRRVISSVVGLLIGAQGPVEASISAQEPRPAQVWDLAAAARVPAAVPMVPTRISGANRYATAARVAASWPEGLGTVFVVSGSQFPDALAAAARAGVQDAPLLLTRRDTVPGKTETALRRLRPQRVVVVGGVSAVAASVLDRLRRHTTSGRVLRLAGTDRHRSRGVAALPRWSADGIPGQRADLPRRAGRRGPGRPPAGSAAAHPARRARRGHPGRARPSGPAGGRGARGALRRLRRRASTGRPAQRCPGPARRRPATRACRWC